jgi:hypothetical protein
VLVADARLKSGKAGTESLVTGDIRLRSVAQTEVRPYGRRRATEAASGSAFVLSPTLLVLGGKEPATIEGRADASGYTLHLAGMVTAQRLLALEAALPQLGDGLDEVVPVNRAAGAFRVDLIASRPWGGPQVWRDASASVRPRRGTRR